MNDSQSKIEVNFETLNFDTRCALSLNSFMCWVSSTTKNGLCLEKIFTSWSKYNEIKHLKQWEVKRSNGLTNNRFFSCIELLPETEQWSVTRLTAYRTSSRHYRRVKHYKTVLSLCDHLYSSEGSPHKWSWQGEKSFILFF